MCVLRNSFFMFWSDPWIRIICVESVEPGPQYDNTQFTMVPLTVMSDQI